MRTHRVFAHRFWRTPRFLDAVIVLQDADFGGQLFQSFILEDRYENTPYIANATKAQMQLPTGEGV